MPRIEEMFAFIIADQAPDDEGVAAFLDVHHGVWLPMTGADMRRVESLMPMAIQLANEHGKKITVVKFTHRETVAVIEPKETQA
jgi:hypothetical protein